MKISKSYLAKVIAEELKKEATQQSYDPNPGKDADGSRKPMWTSKEVPDSPETADKKAWFELVNAAKKTPEQIKQIVKQAKADPEKAKSLAGRTASIDGKILVAGDEQLGKLMSSGQFGKQAREIAKNVLQKRSSGKVSRTASYRKTNKMFGLDPKDVETGDIGAPVAQIRESDIKEMIMQEIKSLLEGEDYDKDPWSHVKSKDPKPKDFDEEDEEETDEED
jgi:hypothetical protein